MRNYILYCLLFINYSIFSQNIEVKYYHNYIITPEKLSETPLELRMVFLQNVFSYTLISNGQISLYKNEKFDDNFLDHIGVKKQYFIHDEKVIEEDELGNKVINTGELVDNVERLKSKELLFYKDFENNRVLAELSDGMDTYNVVDKPFDWNWQISDETKEITGYTCRKAISNLMGYYFEAWYTEDIPVSIGPEKFDGLPGLILYVKAGNMEYIAYSIKLLENPVIINNPNFKRKTYTFSEIFGGSAQKDKKKSKVQDPNIIKKETAIIETK